MAEAEPGRIEIVLRYVISNGGQNSVASFDGNFHAVSLTWIAPNTLAVGLAGESSASPAEAGGLYLVHVLGAVTVEQVKLTCPPSMLVFSPDARFAVGEGDEHTPASLFDSRNGNCQPGQSRRANQGARLGAGKRRLSVLDAGGTRARRGRFPLQHRQTERPSLSQSPRAPRHTPARVS